MAMDDILKLYEEVQDDLKVQNTSSIRTKVMIALSEGPKKTKELREITGMPAATILHGINELEEQGLASKERNNYYLTEIGKIMVMKLADTIKTSVSMKKFRRLWFNHEIDTIPPDLLKDIGDLSNSKLIEAKNTDIMRTHKKHIQVVLNAEEIRGVSPIFYPNYTEVFKNLIEKGVNVELIVTEAILGKTIESLDQGKKDLNKLISTGNLTMWKLNKNVKVAFTITDKAMVLGLFSTKGEYDSTRLLISDHDDAIAWSNRLFEYYRQQSDKIKL